MIKKISQCLIVFSAFLMVVGIVQAAEFSSTNNPAIYKQVVNLPMQKVYPAVYKALEDTRFYVVFEPDIGKNIARFAEKWGDDYNQNQLDSIRSMVFCNGWYANKVSNADPDMLALCPLRLGLYEKTGQTFIVFARPTFIAEKSQAHAVLLEIENAVIGAIRAATKKAQ